MNIKLLPVNNLRTRFAAGVLISVSLWFYGFVSGNATAFYAASIFLAIVYCRIKTGTHSGLTLFLLFYGVLSRSSFVSTSSLYSNTYIFVPLFYSLTEIDAVINALKITRKSVRIFFLVYIFLTLAYTLSFNGKEFLSRAISFYVMIVPIFFFITSKDIRNDIINPMYAAFPFIAIYAAFQYMGVFLPSDIYFIDYFKTTFLTTATLGSSFRPFSTFTSSEELGYFLLITSLSAYFIKNKQAKIYGIAAILFLIIFSYRTAVILFLILSIYHFVKMKMWAKLAIGLIVFLSVFIVIRMLPINTTVLKTDSKAETSFKHGVEPIKQLFKTYSLQKRISILHENYSAFLKKPFGYGLSHNYKLTGGGSNIFGAESSLTQLLLSCGIFMLIFLPAVYLFSTKKLITGAAGYQNILAVLFLAMLPVSHVLSFHFVLPVLYGALLRSVDGKV